MLYLNDTVVTKNGDTAVIQEINDAGIYIEYTSGPKRGWQDYVSVFDIATVEHTY